MIEQSKTQELTQTQIYIFKKVSLVDKYNFFEYMAVMIDGWVSIGEALESVKEKITSVYFKEKITELSTYIYSGDSFSKAMKKLPDIFDVSEISVIQSGEETGSLVQSLQKVSDDLKKIYNLKKKVTGALTYPSIIFIFLFIALIVVLVVVIPSIQPLFDTAQVELPIATQALISTSEFIKNNFLFLIVFLFSLVVFFLGYKNTKSWKIAIEWFLLGLPLIGKVYKNYILSNLVSTLWTLVGSWVNVVKTLSLVWRATNNYIYESLLEEVSLRVSKWEKIVDTMREIDKEKLYFPADFTQMLSVWERTASLDTIAEKMSKQYEREVDYSLANLTKWIEPLAILIAGIFVLWFAFAIFGAILKVTQTVS